MGYSPKEVINTNNKTKAIWIRVDDAYFVGEIYTL